MVLISRLCPACQIVAQTCSAAFQMPREARAYSIRLDNGNLRRSGSGWISMTLQNRSRIENLNSKVRALSSMLETDYCLRSACRRSKRMAEIYVAVHPRKLARFCASLAIWSGPYSVCSIMCTALVFACCQVFHSLLSIRVMLLDMPCQHEFRTSQVVVEHSLQSPVLE